MTSLMSQSSSGWLYANATATTSHTGCQPCSHLNIIPGIADWGPINPSIPVLRTVQLVVDPNRNTTSTSVHCNTAALSAYQTNTWSPEMYSLDDGCNLVARYLVWGVGEDTQFVTV